MESPQNVPYRYVDVVLSGASVPAKVAVPWDFEGSSYLEIDGIGSLEAATRILAPFQFHPIDVNGRSVWAIFGVKHSKSTLQNTTANGASKLGAYNEVFMCVLAAPDATDAASPLAAPGFFVTKIWVDDEAAKVAGNDVWGTNKDLASISVALDPSGSMVSFTMTDPVTHELVVQSTIPTPKQDAGKGTADKEIFIYTRSKQIPTTFWGGASAHKVEANAQLELKLGANGWAAMMKNVVEFQPTGAEFVHGEHLRFGAPLDLMLPTKR